MKSLVHIVAGFTLWALIEIEAAVIRCRGGRPIFLVRAVSR